VQPAFTFRHLANGASERSPIGLRLAIAAGALAVALVAKPVISHAQPALTDAQVKAGFIYNCAMFIEWPEGGAPTGELRVGVVGADRVAWQLTEMQGRRVNGRALKAKAARADDDPTQFQILFVGDDPRNTQSLLTRVGDAPVVTIGENGEFTARGGVIRLFTQQDRLKFEVNVGRAERSGLRLSAKMLGLAKIVR
jgi:hypothetical protein